MSSESDFWHHIEPEPGYSRDLVADSSNNIIILCYETYFDLYDKLASNIIISKFNGTGEKLWNTKWGEHGNAFPIAITVDLEDNIYVVGTFALSSVHQPDVIILKYSKNGILQWSQLWGTNDMDQSRDIAVDSENSVYVSGEFYNLTEQNCDIFLLKFDANSCFKWIRTYTENRSESGRALIIDSFDRIHIGASKTTYIAGNYPWDNGKYIEEACLFTYDKNGNLLNKTGWSKDSGCAVMHMNVDLNDNIYMASRGRIIKFNKNIEVLLNFSSISGTFYDITVDNRESIYMGSNKFIDDERSFDYFIIVYDNSGNHDYNFTYGMPGFDNLKSITIDNFDNLYLLGDNQKNISLVKNPLYVEEYTSPLEESDESPPEEPDESPPEEPDVNGPNLALLIIGLIISSVSAISAGFILVIFHYFKKVKVK
ncbi:MAG: hypothetical protein ACFE9I_18320 [Candidatus Hermodarchaeota archaeon]